MMWQPESVPLVHGWIQVSASMRQPTAAEWAQLVIASLGTFGSFLWVIGAARARAFIIESGRNGGLQLVASGNFRQELLRMMTHLLVLYFGWRRLWVPAFEAPYVELGIELRFVLVMLTMALSLMGLFEWWDRRALQRHDDNIRRRLEGIDRRAVPLEGSTPVIESLDQIDKNTEATVQDLKDKAE